MKRVLLLVLASVFLFSFLSIGCDAKKAETPIVTDKPEAIKTSETTKTIETTKAAEVTTRVVKYRESPYFTGKGLPPVKDRLPKEPKITNEMPEAMLTYEIGTYGGTLRTATSAIDYDADIFIGCNEPLLNSPDILGKKIIGNISK